MGMWETALRDLLHHLQRRGHSAKRISEVEHHPVTEPLHLSASMVPGRPVDHAPQHAGQLGGGLVPSLLGQTRVSTKSRNTIAGTRSGPVSAPASSSAVSMCSTWCSVHTSLLASVPGHHSSIHQVVPCRSHPSGPLDGFGLTYPPD